MIPRIMLPKTVTYSSQNYDGTLGSGLAIANRSRKLHRFTNKYLVYYQSLNPHAKA